MAASRPEASRARSASVRGGTESRISIDTALSCALSGGWPRPSFRWQRWHARALYSGPRPSALRVELGADTHGRRNRALPIANSARASNEMLAEGWENASRSNRRRFVALPPGRRSHRSAASNRLAGARMAARSAGLGAAGAAVATAARINPAGTGAGATARE